MTKPATRPRSLALFRDVEPVLATIFAHETFPARVTCVDFKAAVRWRQRASQFRVRQREQEEVRLGLPSGTGSSPYDLFVFKIEENEVVVTLREVALSLEIGGQKVPLLPPEDDANGGPSDGIV